MESAGRAVRTAGQLPRRVQLSRGKSLVENGSPTGRSYGYQLGPSPPAGRPSSPHAQARSAKASKAAGPVGPNKLELGVSNARGMHGRESLAATALSRVVATERGRGKGRGESVQARSNSSMLARNWLRKPDL